MPSRNRGTNRQGAPTADHATNGTERLLLPALRGEMGDWAYYVALMSLEDVGQRVHMAEEVHPSKALNELIQREISTNAEKIADYLLRQQQRFLNSLVLAVYGGEPQWYEIEVHEAVQLATDEVPETVDMAIGVLALRGDERLFAVDGQHRVKGIKGALAQDPTLGSERIAAIFVAHRNDAEGRTRTRRLFTTLNRYAKPVTTYEKIALDEDDVVAITVRSLLDRHPVLVGRVSTARSRNLPVSDDKSLTSLPALYDAMDLVLRDVRPAQWSALKRFRADDDTLEAYYEKASLFWDLMREHNPPINELAETTQPTMVVPKYRHAEGGHLLFRPVGLTAFARASRAVLDDGLTLGETVARLSQAPMDLAGEPWSSILWSPVLHKMLTTAENVRVAVGLLVFGVGGNLARVRLDQDKLLDQWAGISHRNRAGLTLPLWAQTGHRSDGSV